MGNFFAGVTIAFLLILFVGQVLMVIGKRGQEEQMRKLAKEVEEAECKTKGRIKSLKKSRSKSTH